MLFQGAGTDRKEKLAPVCNNKVKLLLEFSKSSSWCKVITWNVNHVHGHDSCCCCLTRWDSQGFVFNSGFQSLPSLASPVCYLSMALQLVLHNNSLANFCTIATITIASIILHSQCICEWDYEALFHRQCTACKPDACIIWANYSWVWAGPCAEYDNTFASPIIWVKDVAKSTGTVKSTDVIVTEMVTGRRFIQFLLTLVDIYK